MIHRNTESMLFVRLPFLRTSVEEEMLFFWSYGVLAYVSELPI